MHTHPFQFSRVRFFNDYMVAFLTQGGRESRLTRLLLPACQVASLSSVRAVQGDLNTAITPPNAMLKHLSSLGRSGASVIATWAPKVKVDSPKNEILAG